MWGLIPETRQPMSQTWNQWVMQRARPAGIARHVGPNSRNATALVANQESNQGTPARFVTRWGLAATLPACYFSASARGPAKSSESRA